MGAAAEAPQGPAGLPPYPGFKEASIAVLDRLRQRAPLGLWMVTRTWGDDWVVLSTQGAGYDVTDGTVLRWSDSFCSRMVRGEGPRVAPRTDDVPAYAATPVARQLKIGAYVGVPLEDRRGGLFGTLCAVDQSPQSDDLLGLQTDVELYARLLSTILARELDIADARRLASTQEALVDSDTGLPGHVALTTRLVEEEEHARLYGGPVSVVVIDAKPDAIPAIAAAAQTVLGDSTWLFARASPDALVVLAPEAGAMDALRITDGLQRSFAAAHLAAGLGVSVRSPGGVSSLRDALEEAESQARQALR
ncbi:MAG TPA: GAF domain-containing protein [Mycobacteriales bacterium]|nr:GAF domain-containing protein [Mycobacteriales bacterium]